MGVQVALEFHRRYPSRVSGLVLICGSYGNPLDTIHDGPFLKHTLPFFRYAAQRFPELIAPMCRFALKTEVALQLTLSLELNRSLLRRSDLIPYFEHLAEMDVRVFLQTLDSLAEHTAWDHLPRVRVPTLIIAGGQDRFTPMWLSRRMADNIPDAEFHIVPQGSHTATLEQPERVWGWIDPFLKAIA
jgi:pimeloyl-ACP methyl ester carboxylesterase